MVVTDMSSSGERADALGKLGISYGVGMVIGPFIGGLVTKHFGYVIQHSNNCNTIIKAHTCNPKNLSKLSAMK